MNSESLVPPYPRSARRSKVSRGGLLSAWNILSLYLTFGPAMTVESVSELEETEDIDESDVTVAVERVDGGLAGLLLGITKDDEAVWPVLIIFGGGMLLVSIARLVWAGVKGNG